MSYKSVERTAVTPDEAIQSLIIAVVQQAADDYRRMGTRLRTSASQVEKRHIEMSMKGISGFFLGEWYSALTGLENGSEVLEMLDKEVFGDD